MDWLSTSLSDRWMLVLLHFLWQGCLVAALAAGALKLVRPRAPGTRYALLLAALGLLVVLPLATFAVIEPPARRLAATIQPTPQDELAHSAPFPAAPDSPIADVAIPTPALEAAGTFESLLSLDQLASALPDYIAELAPVVPPQVTVAIGQPQADNESVTPPTDWLHRAQPIVLLGWLAGCLLCGLRLGIAFIRTLLLRRGCQTPAPLLWQRTLAIAEVIGLRRVPRLLLSPRVQDAVVVGYLRPLVLLPLAWAMDLPTDVLDAVIAHELAHIRRFDLWVILLQRVTEAVFFYHPAVWWLSLRLSRERELCCDELAASAVGSGRRYAVALEHVAHRLRGLEAPRRLEYSLTPTLGGRKMELLHRVQHALKLDHGPADPQRPGFFEHPGFSRTARLPHGLALAIVPLVLAATAWACLGPQPTHAEPALVANPPDRSVKESAPTATDVHEEARQTAADKVRPSVVAIRTTKPKDAPAADEAKASPYYDPAPVDPAEVPKMIQGCATGIIIDPAGFVLAPHHAVEGVSKCEVTLADGSIHPARSIARQDDFAILSFRPEAEVPALPLDWLRPVDAGEKLQWIGSRWAQGLRTATGKVTSVEQTIKINDELHYDDLIALQGDIAPGDSGGPLFDANGRCRGVMCGVHSGTPRTGFAVPMDQVESIAAELLKTARHMVGVREPATDAGEFQPVVSLRAELAASPDAPNTELAPLVHQGCGVIVDPRGYIATVLPRSVHKHSIRVRLPDGTDTSAVIAAAAPVVSDIPESPHDAVILKVDASAPLLFLPLLDNLKINNLRGARAVIREEDGSFATVTGRCVHYPRTDRLDGRMTQRTKLGLYGGFQPADLGAPVIDADGRLLGLVESIRHGLYGQAEVYECPSLRELVGELNAEPVDVDSVASSNPADDAGADQTPSPVRPSAAAPSPYYFDGDVQYFAAAPEKPTTKAQTDAESALDAALQAWCRGSNEPLHYTFERYVYDLTFQTETRGQGQVWRESPTRWRLDIEPVPKNELPAQNAQGLRVNSRKIGPSGEPFTVSNDVAVRYLQLADYMVFIDAAKASPYRRTPQGQTVWESLQSMAAVDPNDSWWPALFPLHKLSQFWSLPESNPALVDVPREPEVIRALYEVTAGAMSAVKTDRGAKSQRMHLVLTPKSPRLLPQFSRLELMVDRDSGRTEAIKIIDPSGQCETVYVFKPSGGDQQIGDAISIQSARFEGSVPTYYPVYRAVDYGVYNAVLPRRKTQPPTDHLEDVRKCLKLESAAAVELHDRDGQCVLTGQVATQAEADRLLELVRSQRRPAKVREVVSELTVAANDEEEAVRPQPKFDEQEAIHKPLTCKVDVEFIDTPLGDALSTISTRHLSGRLIVDESALRDAGVSLKTPVSLVISGVTVRSTLKLLLEDKDLGWIIDDGKLVVTSRWVVEGKPITKVYAVADLVTPAATNGATSNDEAAAHAKLGDQLVALLTATVQPDAWDVNGGRGGIQFVAGNLALVVRCPQRVHDDVAKWIDRLRTLPGGARRPSILADRTEPEAAYGTREEVLDQSAQERFRRRLTEFQQAAVTEEALRIERALEQLTTVDVDEAPLMKVLEAINREQRINIVVDESGLLESGVTAKTPLTLHLHDVPLKAVLQCLLEPLNLDYVVEDEVLKITGSMRANGFAAESYDLSALLAKEDDPAVQLSHYAELLRQSIAPDSWDQAGGPGHVSPHVPMRKLIVRQSASAHRDIAHLLVNLQRLQAGEASVNPPFSTDAAAEQQAAARLLARRGAVNLHATPLRDLPAALGPLADGKIWLDARGPLEVGRALDMPVSFAAPDISLGEALTQILQPLELEYRVRDGMVVISSPERCGGPATVRVHALPAAWLESLTAGKVTSAALTTQVQNAIDRRYWEARGGLGTITLEGRTQSLVIYQTERRHQEIERFLTQQAGK